MWGEVISIDELERKMKEFIESYEGDEHGDIAVVEVSGPFTMDSLREWSKLLVKHGEKMLKYAVALSMIRGDNKITDAHIRKAFEMVEEGLDLALKQD